jgi:hypothetical protein
MKRFISVLIAMVMLFSFVFLMVGCSSDKGTTGIGFATNDSIAVVFLYSGESLDVIIPDRYGGKPVTRIGEGAFSPGKTSVSIRSVYIPNSVEIIESAAFVFTQLESVSIPGSVTRIGSRAFAYCSELTTVIFSEGLTTIGQNAFAGCEKLINLTLPDSVTEIGDGAFYGCNLLSDEIKEQILQINPNAFDLVSQ